jgi:hypothetical protein
MRAEEAEVGCEIGCGLDASNACAIDDAESAQLCEGVRTHVAALSWESELLRRVDESAPHLELKGRKFLLDVHGSATMGALPDNLCREVVR